MGSVLKDVSGNQPEGGWGERVFQADRPGLAWYTEGQAVSPQHDGAGPWGGGGVRELAGVQGPETCFNS